MDASRRLCGQRRDSLPGDLSGRGLWKDPLISGPLGQRKLRERMKRPLQVPSSPTAQQPKAKCTVSVFSLFGLDTPELSAFPLLLGETLQAHSLGQEPSSGEFFGRPRGRGCWPEAQPRHTWRACQPAAKGLGSGVSVCECVYVSVCGSVSVCM